MNKNKYSIIMFNILFSFVLLYILISVFNFIRCFNYSSSIKMPENYEILRIKIYGSSELSNNNTVSANIAILDTDGSECAVIERSWNGYGLAIELNSLVFNDKYFFFPKNIYSVTSYSDTKNLFKNKKVSSLVPYYLENKKCLLLGKGYNCEYKEKLYTMGKFSFSVFASLFSSFSRKYIIDLSQCKTGIYYTVTVSSNGNIFLNNGLS